MPAYDRLNSRRMKTRRGDCMTQPPHDNPKARRGKLRHSHQAGADSSRDGRKRLATRIVRALEQAYPDAVCALRHANPFELLVATILSAQCTDKMVNQVTLHLFPRFPDAAALAAANPAELERIIHRTGFFRAKAKSLIGMSRALVDQHGGEVPQDLEALTRLPGVGRKTAHVVLGTAFRVPSGVVVDTHVKRLAYRMGLTEHTQADRVERDLAGILPRTSWIDFSHRMIAHGRAVCLARKPRCETCSLRRLCPMRGVA